MMRIESVTIQGFGSCKEPHITCFPDEDFIVIKRKTGGKKTIVYQALMHVFGMEIPSMRLLEDGSSSVVTVKFRDPENYWITRIDSQLTTKWEVRNGTSNVVIGLESKEELFSLLRKSFKSPESIPLFFVSDRTSSMNLVTFGRFLETLSVDYKIILDYYGKTSALFTRYSDEVDALKKELVNFPTQEYLEKNVDKMKKERAKIEKTGEKLKKDLEKAILDLEGKEGDLNDIKKLQMDLKMMSMKISSLKELISRKTDNVNECEEKLASYEEANKVDEILACARKTEVGLDVELASIDNKMSKVSEEKGKLEAERVKIGEEMQHVKSEIMDVERFIREHNEKMMLMEVKFGKIERGNVVERIKKLQKDITSSIFGGKKYSDENAVMAKAVSFIQKHDPKQRECPCCGTRFGKKVTYIINERIESNKRGSSAYEMKEKKARDEIKILRNMDDLYRENLINEERLKNLLKTEEEIEDDINNLEGKLKAVRSRKEELEKERGDVLKLIKAEERMINAIELKQKIETARKELDQLKEDLVPLQTEMDSMKKRIDDSPPVKSLESDISTMKRNMKTMESNIIESRANALEAERDIESLSERLKRRGYLDYKSLLTRKKLEVCTEYLNGIDDMMEKEKRRMNARNLSLGNCSDDLDIVSFDKKNNQIVRKIGDDHYKQNVMSFSSGEKVVVNIEAKAKNKVWRDGGFAVIDANLSDDAVNKCTSLLLKNGCDQVIFLSVGNEA